MPIKIKGEEQIKRKAKIHVKKIKNYLINDFVARRIASNETKLIYTKDPKLKKCIRYLRKYRQKNKDSIMSPLYLSCDTSIFRKNIGRTLPNTGSQRFHRCKELFTNIKNRQYKIFSFSKDHQPGKLTEIWRKYCSLMKDSEGLKKYSGKCKELQRQLLICENILKELTKQEKNIKDLDTNLEFYIWNASKSCEGNYITDNND